MRRVQGGEYCSEEQHDSMRTKKMLLEMASDRIAIKDDVVGLCQVTGQIALSQAYRATPFCSMNAQHTYVLAADCSLHADALQQSNAYKLMWTVNAL